MKNQLFKALLQNPRGNKCEVIVRKEYKQYYVTEIITQGVKRETVNDNTDHFHTNDGGYLIVPTNGIMYDRLTIIEKVA